jgi:hypothetical protein
MRYLLLLLAASCMSTSEQAITGEYLTNFDSVTVTLPGGGMSGSSVVEVTVRDEFGDTYDHGYFHSETVNGTFQLSAPDGSTNLHALFVQHTADGNDHHIEYLIEGPIHSTVEMGLVDLTR